MPQRRRGHMQPHWHVDVEYAGVGSERHVRSLAGGCTLLHDDGRGDEDVREDLGPSRDDVDQVAAVFAVFAVYRQGLKGEYSLVGLRGGNRSSATE